MYLSFKYKTGGFTLIELMVSIAIMAVILTVIMLNQKSYTEVAILVNTADELGLSISEAQAYGVAVKERVTGSTDFTSGYGISLALFEQEANVGYIFFSDRNGSLYYDGNWACSTGEASECLKKAVFSGGNEIYELCRVRDNPNNPYQCNIGRIDITFSRPSTEARIKSFNQQGNLMDDDPDFIGARIGIRSPGGMVKSIIVYYTGQISIQ
ncbi:MAG: hypothetical protein A3F53_01740 [Candidatus Zambryskibacteria bacterium RIFCSPHIGHO2_12_FULL_48_10]|uniref:Prepilin-type N-terminal cleavage/methylation domain-containing protein n=1 Tax=Candidatus Zambryskibacteria bacterium RIFCSPHIGHO2_01_FULL_46_25 TaxID=1802738 RepID=A0A1G2T1F6_9BACT|nr:MAG: hypothetical protein UX71_C0002G0041 [Parcubacteria group bacterium GW2011_GWA1_47_10]OHA90669.1 MAG: hypothetical protein A2838_03050 [Candidatus Zambryskibacteria bacterium RIFCSPHIGHO2_01_FULL_46_25]OHB02493.1 MAG: hypothetical protein A3F53_01740 [Candidatus Zambryskibacteria bacterium RIFCSPHIGHO2_12_FULL_48_10]OHB07312.1 MAG: hypothetical protein A3A31_02190 [Candidatus Zambryskibacteria bacterium RIFCSPLOWO2_01_FULL_48_25]